MLCFVRAVPCSITLEYFNEKTGRIKNTALFCLIAIGPIGLISIYTRIVHIKFRYLKNDFTYMQCSFALYFVAIASHPK